MSLIFENLSYSYDEPKKQRKRPKSKAVPGDGTCQSEPEQKHNWALKDINFTLEAGEFLGLAGHTGSGKSTLVQHANGLIHPNKGRVLFKGRDLSDKQVAQECRSAVGLVFQYPEHQLFAASVQEDIAFGPRNLGLSEEEVEKRVDEALNLVHLDPDDVAQRSPFELSGGQQRRVAFAGVLAMKPQVLVMDEPVAGLDPVARAEFLDLIDELHKSGLSIMMASHSMEDLARLADRILVLHQGRMHRYGSPEEVFSDVSGLKEVGLDAPAPQRFAVQLREAGFNLPRALYDIDTLAHDLAPQLRSAAKDAQDA